MDLSIYEFFPKSTKVGTYEFKFFHITFYILKWLCLVKKSLFQNMGKGTALENFSLNDLYTEESVYEITL